MMKYTTIWLVICLFFGLSYYVGNDSVGTSATNADCEYRALGALPDASCDPGAVNLHVQQSNIHKTICVSGYTKTIRPPVAYTEPLKRKEVVAYGNSFGQSLRNYEYDHLIPLELGGDPKNVKNLWPEPIKVPGGHGAFGKDAVENKLHKQVCDGTMTLKRARYIMRHDWRQG